jgi:hypothetical protein
MNEIAKNHGHILLVVITLPYSAGTVSHKGEKEPMFTKWNSREHPSNVDMARGLALHPS